MLELQEIYEEAKYLDILFNARNNLKSQEIINKNILELLVEIGELANETRCFKYWSLKKASPKEVILEEYIDCLFMILSFCNLLDISLKENFQEENNLDLVSSFINLYEKTSSLKTKLEKEQVKYLLVDIFHIAKLLNFTLEDLKRGSKLKSLIIQKRFQEDY